MGTDDSDRIKKWQRFARDGACAPPDANVKQLVAAQSDYEKCCSSFGDPNVQS